MPVRLTLTGIVFSILLIQVVMRKCYDFSNLLFAPKLPQTALGFERLFLADGQSKALFFAGLMAGTVTVFCLLVLAKSRMNAEPSPGTVTKVLLALLAFLAVVQTLLLPVNYDVFIKDKYLARVADLGDQAPLDACRQGPWLMWEGSQGVTYFVVEDLKASGNERAVAGTGMDEAAQRVCVDRLPLNSLKRSLITLPQKDMKRTQIVGYDQILSYIFER
jgi:hypothetical protein